MTQNTQSRWNGQSCELLNLSAPEPELIFSQAWEWSAAPNNFWRGVMFAFLLESPLFLVALWLWLT
jgi:hypothetical protein